MKSLLVVIIILSTNLWATQKAQVIVVRGKVTKLEPKSHKATVVKKGDWLLQDTSVLTQEKSFIKLRFNDGAIMNLGPKSMAVINKMPDKKANMVNLLTGMVNAEVKKEKEEKNKKTKFIVRTRSAIMGVRGTKFQTSYNAANKRTTLVTVEGKVAMAKKIKPQASSATELAPDETFEKLDEVFENNSNQVVEVEAGEFSGIAESVEKPTEPVNIAPEQYNALAKVMDHNQTAEDVMESSADKSTAEAEFKNNVKVKPKSGGYVDFATGLYIEPTQNAKYDEKTGTFRDENIGKVNSETAEYIPPKGLALDANKGFILAQTNELNEAEKKEVQKNLMALNSNAKNQMAPKVSENSKKVEKEPESSWGPDQHIFSLTYIPYREKMKVDVDAKDYMGYTPDQLDVASDQAQWTMLSWKQIWNEKWNSRIRMAFQDYELDEDSKRIRSDDNKNDGDSFFSLGIQRKMSENWTFLFDITKRNEMIAIPDKDNSIRKNRQEFDYFDIGFQYRKAHSDKTYSEILSTIHLGPEKDSVSFDQDQIPTVSNGVSLQYQYNYLFTPKTSVDLGVSFRRMIIENDQLYVEKQEMFLILGLNYLL